MAVPAARSGPPEAFDGPTLIPYATVRRSFWDGGDQSGRTLDYVYADSADACQIVFSLPPGGRFLHAGDGFDAYERDIVWRVLTGVLAAANPATGEVHVAGAGESLHFGGETWLDGWSQGPGAVTVVEFTAPTRARAGRIDRRPWPSRPSYARDGAPPSRPEAGVTVRRLGGSDVLWRLEGDRDRVLVGHVVSTPHLTVGEVRLPPGGRGPALERDGTTTMYVLEGVLGIELPGMRTRLEAGEKDGVYLPPGVSHRPVNVAAGPVRALYQVVAGAGE
jgi:quercetin dioxygenase-like cupin family protein